MIKYIFLIIMMAITARAENSLELVGPGVTFHVIDGGVSNLYSNKLSNDGRLIYTAQLGLRYVSSEDFGYSSIGIFRALNSVGSPITGAIYGYGISMTNLNVGFVAGGYIQNNNDFYARGIQPFTLFGGTNALVPLVGFEINMKIPISKRTFIGFNNILSPVITNHNMSIGIKY